MQDHLQNCCLANAAQLVHKCQKQLHAMHARQTPGCFLARGSRNDCLTASTFLSLFRPDSFDTKDATLKADAGDMSPAAADSDASSSEDDMPPLHQNNNRQVIYRHEDAASASDDEA